MTRPLDALSPTEADAELSALVSTLHATEQRLEELTGGEVDTVADRDGRTFLLRKARDHLRLNEAVRFAAILNALPAHIALLDSQGLIISVNEPWRRFASENALLSLEYGAGLNYLEVCDSARGNNAAEATPVAAGIRLVLAGKAKDFSLEYPCHSPAEQRWFHVTVTPLSDEHPDRVVVMHLDITERKLAEQELLDSRQRLDAVVTSAMDGIITIDSDRRIVLINPAALAMFGYAATELLGQPLELLLPDRFRAGHSAQVAAFANSDVSSRKVGEFSVIFGLRKDREEFPIEVSISHDKSSERSFFIATMRDVTERINSEQRIRYLNRVYAVLRGITSLIVRVQDRDTLFNEACRIAVETGGFRMAVIGMVDRSGLKIVPVATAGKDEELVDTLSSILSSGKFASRTMATRLISAKQAVVCNDSQNDPQVLFGNEYAKAGVCSILILPLIISDEAIGALALYADEVEFFHEEEIELLTELSGDIAFAIDHIYNQEKLDYLAYYDALTGLANRSLFLERVAQYVRSAVSGGHKLALCLIDLERFKNINDSVGWSAGNELLKQVTEWLTRNAGDVSLLARVGADHFALVLPDVRQGGDVARKIEKTLAAFLDHPFRLNDEVFRIAAKVGIAMFPDDGADADTLFKNAEAALKMAKRSGDRYLFHTQKMTEAVAAKLALENHLRQALDNEEFVLHYQPKVDLASGKVSGAEALIRWNDPRTGLVPPAMFIPALEDTGLIYQVGRWALKKSLDDYLRWRDAGFSVVRLAVNVSPLQLRHPDFVASIEQLLAVDVQAAQGLELEITESMIMEDMQQSVASLQAIRAMGICVAIDDFGTGFSSLGYLSKLPVDTLKIDRSFVDDMTRSPGGQDLVSTIIGLAHSLSLKVVAEGVETEHQARLLRLLKCDEMQGYLFSKPVPADIFEAKFLKPPCSS